ncbi:hypothetical protein [Halobacillus sp. Marseille-Q1614]|uniref:hypothetical protein n=1 Tax=Halobacillus sp. Marseille-Q1614 TaxID=2709134 RepID=UPI00156FD986|nr:hypothetical protein [Halobacillus sp. Marseille-Q1614]
MNKKEKAVLIDQVVEEIYKAYPELWDRFGDHGHERTEEDNYHHLDHLFAAYEMNSASFFLEYTDWLNNVLTSRGVGTQLIVDNYNRLIRHLSDGKWENPNEVKTYINYLELGLERLQKLSQ